MDHPARESFQRERVPGHLLHLWPLQSPSLRLFCCIGQHTREVGRHLEVLSDIISKKAQKAQPRLAFASLSASTPDNRAPAASSSHTDATPATEDSSEVKPPAQQQLSGNDREKSWKLSLPGRSRKTPLQNAEVEDSNSGTPAPLTSTKETACRQSLGSTPKGPGSAHGPPKRRQGAGWFEPKLPDWLPKRMPNLQPFWVILTPPGQPDKKRLMTVQDFFKYTEEEGKQFWRELDRDCDDKISVDDVKAVLRQRKLPESYASDFIKAARGNRWWSNSISWEEFKAVVDEREPKMLRAFTSMEVNPAGGLSLKSIKGTLGKVGVAATDEHAKAMIKALGVEEDGVVSYGKFRNFLILLPEAKLTGIDPSAVWFEAATVVPFGPPPSERSKEQRTSKMLLTAALAGGIASCVSTVTLFPLDTLKTRLQSTAGASIASVAKAAPNIGVRGLYRGIIPAATGNFVSHGIRTFSYEASFSALSALSKGSAELQIQGLSSGIGTFLGTCIRIPCEVLKQRLQTGRHPNVIQAIGEATKLEGPRGLFRGTVATLSREVPFYVMGIVFFEQLKKLAKGSSFGGKGRDLAPWETIALGALAGALASVGTTPADVMKTRVMTAAANQAVDPKAIFIGIIQNEGVGALFKGALFRAAWTAPQGAMNFSGYELAKKALSQRDLQQQQDKEFVLEPAA